jgi:signal transduction histidine kinase
VPVQLPLAATRREAGCRESVYRLAVVPLRPAVRLALEPPACDPPRVGGPGKSTLARDLAVGGLAVAAGIAAAALALHSDRQSEPVAPAALALVVGWAYIGSGLFAWRHRPDNGLGRAMILVGFAFFAIFLADADESWTFTVGTALETVYLIAFVYLILSFPTGRLRTRTDRLFIGCGLALGLGLEVVWMLFADSHAVICSDCPPNAFELVRRDGLAEGLLQAQRVAGVVLALVTAVVLVRRWRRASAPERRSAAPVLWSGSAVLVALAIAIVNDVLDQPLGLAPGWLLSFVFAAIPFAVLAVLLQRRLARGAVAGLIVELQGGTKALDLREVLGRALGDPSLQLAYWFPGQGRYVAADGSPVELPEGDARRVATIVARDGEPVAALVHDAALRDNAELVDSVCAAAGLTLENERLRAELLAKLAELQASRARLVEATESERRRIERDLHDGTQQRLVSIAMTLGLAESKLAGDRPSVGPVLREARDALTLALEELRELSQGIRPAILVERGLPAALDDLSRRAALPVRLETAVGGRLPEQVETAAYFVVSEALTNATKHSHATEVRVLAAREGNTLVVEIADDGIGGAGGAGGSGLRGLADRVEAIGGRLTVSSPPGRGTLVRAEVPCA